MHFTWEGNKQCPAAANQFEDSIFANIDAYEARRRKYDGILTSRRDFLHLSIITTVFNFIYTNSHSSSSKYIHVASFTCKNGKQRYKKLVMHTYLVFIFIFCHVQLKKILHFFFKFNSNLKAIKCFPCSFK